MLDGSKGPNDCEMKFFAQLQKLKTANQLWNVEITWFFKRRNAPKPHFPEFRPGPHWANLQRFPSLLSWRGAVPKNLTPFPLLTILASDFIFTGLVLQSRLAKPPVTDWNDAFGFKRHRDLVWNSWCLYIHVCTAISVWQQKKPFVDKWRSCMHAPHSRLLRPL